MNRRDYEDGKKEEEMRIAMTLGICLGCILFFLMIIFGYIIKYINIIKY